MTGSHVRLAEPLGAAFRAKFAKQMEFAFRTMDVAVPVPAQLPDQPVKTEPATGTADKAIVVFCV